MGPDSDCFWLFCRPCCCGLGGRDGGVCALGLPPDLKDEAAAASGAEERGAGDETASRADSLLSTTQMMSLMDFVAMEASLRTSRRISVS